MPSEILAKRLYIRDCKISLAFLSFFLIRSFIRIRSFFLVGWSLLKKLNLQKESLVLFVKDCEQPPSSFPLGHFALFSPAELIN